MRSKYYILSALLLSFCLSGCKVKRPKEVISEKKMEDILYDYHIAKAMGEHVSYTDNYKKTLYMEYVFKKHGTTGEVFDSSMVWYTRNTEILSKIYENVTDRFKKEQGFIDNLVSIRDNKPKISQPGDSVDVWIWDRIYHLTGHALNNKVTFKLPSDSNFYARDTLSWQVRYHFIDNEPDSADAPWMAMQVMYTNDSIISDIRRIFNSGIHQVHLQSDTLGDIKEIKGFVYYPATRDSLNKLLMDQISLKRYHSTDTLFKAKTDSIDNEKQEEEVKSVITEEVKQEKPVTQEPTEAERRRAGRARPAAAGTSREMAPVRMNTDTLK
ncbi:DUF4296 domain-containing protein [Bacteroides sp. 224]|uniref:DUF4296 domain-containing protein n=1 Tax=Bacteroides sp. 224 TaxID=2302936 RepID=UPI0013D45D69|nr:DUF4296 domain-containing protein [Bacteroides sp. 224]NDV64345.1 DUF4296 domain-containing protein [Bacteroides sp. 224]